MNLIDFYIPLVLEDVFVNLSGYLSFQEGVNISIWFFPSLVSKCITHPPNTLQDMSWIKRVLMITSNQFRPGLTTRTSPLSLTNVLHSKLNMVHFHYYSRACFSGKATCRVFVKSNICLYIWAQLWRNKRLNCWWLGKNSYPILV